MATFNAPDLLTRSIKSGGEGNTFVNYGTITPTAGASGDIYRICRIPAGIEVTDVLMKNGDLDSNGSPTLAGKLGYVHEDGSSGSNDAAFIAAGSTRLQAAAAMGVVDFAPGVVVEKDSFLVWTNTAGAATFASAAISAIVKGVDRGAK